MAEWTDEERASVVEEYTAANPTPENSMEIVKEIAEKYNRTANGVMAILTRAKVYVKKTPGASKSTGSGEKKETKAESLKRLSDVISANGGEPNDEIIGKLTGKAAAYFADTITKMLDEV